MYQIRILHRPIFKPVFTIQSFLSYRGTRITQDSNPTEIYPNLDEKPCKHAKFIPKRSLSANEKDMCTALIEKFCKTRCIVHFRHWRISQMKIVSQREPIELFWKKCDHFYFIQNFCQKYFFLHNLTKINKFLNLSTHMKCFKKDWKHLSVSHLGVVCLQKIQIIRLKQQP